MKKKNKSHIKNIHKKAVFQLAIMKRSTLIAVEIEFIDGQEGVMW